MSKHIKKAFDMLNAAKPPSGFRPETIDEWCRLHRAFEEMGYAMFREAGLSNTQARQMARETFGGPGGLLLLDIGFSKEQQ